MIFKFITDHLEGFAAILILIIIVCLMLESRGLRKQITEIQKNVTTLQPFAIEQKLYICEETN